MNWLLGTLVVIGVVFLFFVAYLIWILRELDKDDPDEDNDWF